MGIFVGPGIFSHNQKSTSWQVGGLVAVTYQYQAWRVRLLYVAAVALTQILMLVGRAESPSMDNHRHGEEGYGQDFTGELASQSAGA